MNLEVVESGENTVFVRKDDEGKELGKQPINTKAYNVISNLEGKVGNAELQVMIADATGWTKNKQGRCPKAAALLERFTPGYSAFNSLGIALLIGHSEGRNRFFTSNQGEEVKATMLTRQNSPASGKNKKTENLAISHSDVQTVTVHDVGDLAEVLAQ